MLEYILDEETEIELEIVYSDCITIDNEQELTTLPAPIFPTLLETVQLPAAPLCICHYKRSTYVGLENSTVARIDSNYKLYESFISYPSYAVQSLAIYKGNLYMLLHKPSSPLNSMLRGLAMSCKVRVCDMYGRETTHWYHSCSGFYCNVLTVVSDQVVIADPPNKRVTVYSLTGQILRHVPCPLLSNLNTTATCAGDGDFIIVSDRGSSQVFRFNINTGDVMWTYKGLHEPQGVTCYRRVVVVTSDDGSVKILDVKTGESL